MPDCSTPLPLPNLFSDVEPLTPDMLPNTIREYIFDIAERQQCLLILLLSAHYVDYLLYLEEKH